MFRAIFIPLFLEHTHIYIYNFTPGKPNDKPTKTRQNYHICGFIPKNTWFLGFLNGARGLSPIKSPRIFGILSPLWLVKVAYISMKSPHVWVLTHPDASQPAPEAPRLFKARLGPGRLLHQGQLRLSLQALQQQTQLHEAGGGVQHTWVRWGMKNGHGHGGSTWI